MFKKERKKSILIKWPIQYCLISLFIFFLFSCHSMRVNVVVSPEYSRDHRLRVAVLDFDFKAWGDKTSIFYGSGSSKNAGKMIADLLTEEMMSIPGVVVVERSKLKSILDERKLSMSGLLESDELEKIAKLTGINALVAGSVGDALALNILGVYQESMAAFQARCIRASDGVLLWSGSVVSETGSHNVAENLHFSAKRFGKELRKKLPLSGIR